MFHRNAFLVEVVQLSAKRQNKNDNEFDLNEEKAHMSISKEIEFDCGEFDVRRYSIDLLDFAWNSCMVRIPLIVPSEGK